jgi:hypothetical protein
MKVVLETQWNIPVSQKIHEISMRNVETQVQDLD